MRYSLISSVTSSAVERFFEILKQVQYDKLNKNVKYGIVLSIITMTCFSCQQKHDVPQTITLNNNWQFKKVSDTIWRSATVPGDVFSDLLDNKLIEDPFILDNEKGAQWVSETDWEYKTNFALSEDQLQKKHLQLNFEGLDTYAKIFLNDSLILNANNAFRQWEVDVKPLLKEENQLRILFERTSKQEAIEKSKLPYDLPEGNRIFTRKAQFQYGWDWGPKLNTSGIWRPIKLVGWNDFRIENVYLKQIALKDTSSNHVAEIKFNSNLKEDLSYSVYVNDSLIRNVNLNLSTYNPDIPFSIKNPKLWWPHNLGEPYLYDIKVVVKDHQKILDSISVKHGIRKIDLITEKDSLGESFYFKVNGVPVYAKGANYIPQHSFQNEVQNSHYERLLNDVIDANMNMLRIWGGGIYENDMFYDLCDEKGILVWQDFMFACAMYPGDDDFLNNVAKEAEDNIKRLRNHASIALWCGNNESSEGWYRWGWQANRSDTEKKEIWSNYLKVFDSILPNKVTTLTEIDYWESSPKYGRGNPKYKFEGDAHDWWIWHDAYPFEHLEENIPRFMSEFGFQSFPSYDAIRYINQSDSINISSEGFKNHQKHARGFQLIDEYMKRDFPVPNIYTENASLSEAKVSKSTEDYIYMSQVLQAYGITKGIEAQRRAKPYNMGTLYWQLNDCWPVVSWSSIDFIGNWKALHYKVKRSFSNVLVSSKVEDKILKTWIVNDNNSDVNGNLNLKIIDFDGKVLWEKKQEITSKALSSIVVNKLNLDTLSIDKNAVALLANFKDKTSVFYFSKPKDLKLKQAEIQKEIIKTDEGFEIQLKSPKLQKDVFLYTKHKGHFSDNYFDLLPNETKQIYFTTKARSIEDLQYKSLNQFLR